MYRKSLLRPYLYLVGLLHLRRGQLQKAETCFSRVVLLDPKSFNARVQLGRVYFLLEEFFKAEQQFLKAQEIDPRRFHRNHLPEDYTCWEEIDSSEEQANSLFGNFEAEGSLYSFQESSYQEPTFEESAFPVIEGPEEAESFHFGDFSSYQEWKRFQAMPPISRSEMRNTDWDQIFSDPLF